jgi:hypothetical protein
VHAGWEYVPAPHRSEEREKLDEKVEAIVEGRGTTASEMARAKWMRLEELCISNPYKGRVS